MIDKFKDNGYALFIFATVMFSFMGLFVKLSVSWENIPVFEVIFFRSFVNLVLIILYAKVHKSSLKTHNRPLLIIRSLLGFSAFTCFFFSIKMINLADAIILSYTAPVFTAILSAIILKERFSVKLFLSVCISLAGAALVVKPSGNFFNSGGFFGIMSGVLAAVTFITIRKLSYKNSSSTIIFWFTAISSLLSFPFAMNVFIVPSAKGILYLFFIGALSTAGQLAMTKGYRLLEAQKGSMVMLFNIVLSALLSYFVLHEVLDEYTIMGGALVFISSIGVLIFKPLFFHKHPNRQF